MQRFYQRDSDTIMLTDMLISTVVLTIHVNSIPHLPGGFDLVQPCFIAGGFVYHQIIKVLHFLYVFNGGISGPVSYDCSYMNGLTLVSGRRN